VKYFKTEQMGILEAQLQKRRSSNVRKPEEEAIIPDQCHLKNLNSREITKCLGFQNLQIQKLS